MQLKYTIYEKYFDTTLGEIIQVEVRKFADEEEAIEFFDDNNDRDNLILIKRELGNRVYTWNSKYEEWET